MPYRLSTPVFEMHYLTINAFHFGVCCARPSSCQMEKCASGGGKSSRQKLKKHALPAIEAVLREVMAAYRCRCGLPWGGRLRVASISAHGNKLDLIKPSIQNIRARAIAEHEGTCIANDWKIIFPMTENLYFQSLELCISNH